MSKELREEARRREKERAALARWRDRFAGDLRALAALPEGRRFFRWLIDQGNLFVEDYQPGPMGAYRAGVRATSLRLWRLLERHLPTSEFVAVALEAGRRQPEEAGGCDEESAITEDTRPPAHLFENNRGEHHE